ncbi:Sortilin, partial [Favolaschia claudopus]
LLLCVFLCIPFVLAQNAQNTVTSLGRDIPTNLLFFPNSSSAIRYSKPDRNIYVSHDAGRSWKRPSSMPGGMVDDVIFHPFNNSMAFVVTTPRDPKVAQAHYRTDDGGQSWTRLEFPPLPLSLSFHSDPNKPGHIILLREVCDKRGRGRKCYTESFVTKDAFSSPPEPLLNNTIKCQFVHSSQAFRPQNVHSDLIYCIQDAPPFNTNSGTARLYSSTDFFKTEKKLEELCAGKGAKGFITANPHPFDVFASTPHFAVFALQGANSDVTFCVSKDLKTWVKTEIPPRFTRAQYSLVSAGSSLGIDVYTSAGKGIGTLYMSDESGALFSESLKDTNWAKASWLDRVGVVDSEAVASVPGVLIVNVVANAADVMGRGADRVLKTVISYDNGHSWAPIAAGPDLCNQAGCSLHIYPRLYSREYPRTESGSAGVIVGVGSAGLTHRARDQSDTFMSTDAGLTWTKLSDGAFVHRFGDAGSILVMINNDHPVHELQYSLDSGSTWYHYDFGTTVVPIELITVPEPNSWKFILHAERSPPVWADHYVYIFFDFTDLRKSKCSADDFETWYAASPGSKGCLMGSKQPFKRRKLHRDCYVGDLLTGILASEGSCSCSDADYECEHNFRLDGPTCVAALPEPIPSGMCKSVEETYMGSSGYRKIPGNTCTGGSKDAPVQKSCQQEEPNDGAVVHRTFEFPSKIIQREYVENSTTILVLLQDHSMWQSSNEGSSWKHLYPEERFTRFYLHKYDSDRVYLVTDTEKFYFTVDGGRTWAIRKAPSPPTSFRVQALRFHTDPDTLLWLGDRDCKDFRECHIEAQYSRDNGRTWAFVEKYVLNCAWAIGTKLAADAREILCESYTDKTGSQMLFQMGQNPLALVEGPDYFKTKKKIFDQVVGFAKYSEFLIVAELRGDPLSLQLQVSLDGVHFATGQFPHNMKPETHAYTILDSSTASLFVHMTMTEPSNPQLQWGNVLKSNSNGTYFGLSAEHVNRDARGYVDFEKMAGLDGIALINIVSNSEEAHITGRKVLQSRITHNDGSTWKSLPPPKRDSLGNSYSCSQCALHVHGFTERRDFSATFSVSSVVGLIMAVGNVGESLAPYDQSDLFLSRDGGFTWEEVHKDAHLWKIGDSGSVIVIANDEEATDHVLFSTDEGMSWHHYKFSESKIRVRSIMTIPADTSRRFLLFGHAPRSSSDLAIFIDFSALTSRQCMIDIEDPGHDDFELWSPSDERDERCLFGRQSVYHRRRREANCYVGTQPKASARVERACTCLKTDYECEFNYYKNAEGDCVLATGRSPLPNDETCSDGAEFWYERTAYRKITFSSCEGGERLDRGERRPCVRSRTGHGGFFWFFMLAVPLVVVGLAAYWYRRNAGASSSPVSERLKNILDRLWPRRERQGYEAVPLD